MTVGFPIGHAVMQLYGYVARRCAIIGLFGFEARGRHVS